MHGRTYNPRLRHPAFRTNREAIRSGLTLVELMVVVVILVILVGVVLPLAQPALKGREIREAARQVNTMFASARARAAATGRPVGVAIIPQAGQTDRLLPTRLCKDSAPLYR